MLLYTTRNCEQKTCLLNLRFCAHFATIEDMKGLLRQYVLILAVIYCTSLIFPGITIGNGLTGLLTATVFLLFGFVFVKPILSIITLPLNVITFGLFSVVITAVVLFLVSSFYNNFTITPFAFPGVQIFTFIIQPFQVNLFLSYIIISATIQLLMSLTRWLFDL